MSLTKKVDFSIIFSTTKANPNGDPLNGNRPRTDYEGFGEVSDVCLKRKLRNRLQDMGEDIYVQSDDNRKAGDTYRNLRERFEKNSRIQAEIEKQQGATNREELAKIACEVWFDVRAFGQVFAFKKGNNNEEDEGSDSVSIGVRGPVTIQNAVSLAPVEILSQQITKSVNLEPNKKDPDKKGPDTMGMKHRVEHGIYVSYGSINCQLAEKTGFSDEDAEKIRQALLTLFENDASSARPDGSMEVCRLYWWQHDSKTPKFSSAKVHRSLQIKAKDGVVPKSIDDYEISVTPLENLVPKLYE